MGRNVNEPMSHDRKSLFAEPGFTLVEVLISILVTMIVMSAVFGLLTRGQRSFEREPEIADLQQSGRACLDLVSRDALQAGGGLPPEFPAFSRINGAGDSAPTDVLEMVGAFQAAGEIYLDPEPVVDLNGNDLVMGASTTNLEVGDLVVVYNDVPNDTPPFPQWAMARVSSVVEDPLDPTIQATVTLDYALYDPQYSRHAQPGSAPDPTQFFSTTGQPALVTRASVIRYFTVPDDPANYTGPPPEVLMRSMDFDPVGQAVGYLDDFQVRYAIGVTAPVEQNDPPDPVLDLGNGVAITPDNMLSGVRLTVTARSVTAGMEGASEGAAGREDDFIRKTFSTNVNPRNITAGIDTRTLEPLSAGPPTN